MESKVLVPKRLKKTSIAAMMPVLLACFAAPAFAQGPIVPAPISSYAGDPGTAGNPASWRTPEFLRDWGNAAVDAEYAYAAGFAGAGVSIGVVDSGVFSGPPLDVEHGDRFFSVTADGGTTGPTPGFYNQAYNDSHGTHVSGTVGASRDGDPNVMNMHGVAFDADVYYSNTHKTDSVYYGLQPAGAADRLLLDNDYIGNVYRATAGWPTRNQPVRIVHSSWGSQPSTENYNTYDGENAAWKYISTPNGVADANGHTVHWLQGAIEVARQGTIINFTAGNGGYANTTPRGSSTYFMPELEGHWLTTSAVRTLGQTFNADGSVLVPGTQQYNQCGVAKWACITAPGNAINSTRVTVSNGVPVGGYGSLSGTSMAGPHAAAVLGIIMQRFPYMENDQALYTMFTSSRQNATTSDSTGAQIPNPTAGQIVAVPDSRNGWGTVNLKDAMNGPGQVYGLFSIDTKGYNDIWSNNLSDTAAKARKIEDDAEAVAWEATKLAKGWVNGVPNGASYSDQVDYQTGHNREVARSTRAYLGSLTKKGAGTLYLSGNDTFATSTVAGGTLSITGTYANSIAVNGGTLAGTGTINGSVSVLSGTVAPGVLPDELSQVRTTSLSAGNILHAATVKIGPAGGFATTVRGNTDYTQLQATGTVLVGGALTVNVVGAPTPGSTITIIHSNTTVVGTFRGLPEGTTFAAGGHLFKISYLGGNVTLMSADIAVPS